MFRRLTQDQLRARDLGDRFRIVFTLTLIVTFLTFPIVLGGPEAGQLFGFTLFFGLSLLVSIFIPVVIIAAITMSVTHRLLLKFLPPWGAFIFACLVSAFISIVISCHLDFSFQSPYVSWAFEPLSLDFSLTLGVYAACVAAIVSMFFCRMGDFE